MVGVQIRHTRPLFLVASGIPATQTAHATNRAPTPPFLITLVRENDARHYFRKMGEKLVENAEIARFNASEPTGKKS
jgi:hypothetical protein